MAWSKRINRKKYAIGTSVNLVFACYAGYPSIVSILCLAYVVIGAFLNQYFTILVFDRFVQSMTSGNDAVSKRKMALYLVLKLLFLITAFLCLLSFSRDKILQGLLLYIFQLIILTLSIKNIEQLLKKGSPP